MAFIIDGLIVGGATMLVTLPAMFFLLFSQLPETRPDGSMADPGGFLVRVLLIILLTFALSMGLSYLYFVELMFRSGQTVGKRVAKVRVTPLDPAGGPLTRAMAAKRWLVSHVAAAVLPGLNWVDGLWQLWDKPYQQCLHDKFAGTVVIKPPA